MFEHHCGRAVSQPGKGAPLAMKRIRAAAVLEATADDMQVWRHPVAERAALDSHSQGAGLIRHMAN